MQADVNQQHTFSHKHCISKHTGLLQITLWFQKAGNQTSQELITNTFSIYLLPQK